MAQSTEPTDIPIRPLMHLGPIPEGHIEAAWMDMEQLAASLNAGAALIRLLRETVAKRDNTIAKLRAKVKLLREPKEDR